MYEEFFDNRASRRVTIAITGFVAFALAFGCTSTVPKSNYSQAQLNAIETRDVDASLEETFSAASGAMFDAGYTIAMSDRAAGLLTGSRAKDKSSERFWVDPSIQDTKFLISMQVRATDAKHCTVRVKTSINGEPFVDKKAIDQIWVLMQRQVMMKEPSAALSGDGVEQPSSGKK